MNTHTIYKRTMQLGKVDGYGNGRKDCALEVTLEIERITGNNKKTVDLQPISDYYTVSLTGAVWNRLHTDYLSGGQMQDRLLSYLDAPYTRRLVEVWDRWHLNDLKAGTRRQTETLDRFYSLPYPSDEFTSWALGWLDQCTGLQRDAINLAQAFYDLARIKTELAANKIRRDYNLDCLVLGYFDLLYNEDYKYGSAWLVDPISKEQVEELIAFFEGTDEQPPEADLIDQVKISYETDLPRQSDGSFKGMLGVRVKLTYKGRSASFTWYAGDAHLTGRVLRPDARTVIGSLVSDLSFDDYSVSDLQNELGYTYRQAAEIKRKVTENKERLQHLFGENFDQLLDN